MNGVLISLALMLCADAAEPKSEVTISLERMESGGAWKALDPRTVLQKNDRVRFRMETSFGGYLFVNNLGSDGAMERVFPPQGTGADNRVEPGKTYILPSAEGSFLIDGPPGFDITYWVITPGGGVPQAIPDAPRTSNVNTLIPRCKEGTLAARGNCIDDRAGPQRTTQQPQGGLRARSLKIDRGKDQSTKITGGGSANAPMVYEFRIAHQ